MSQDEVQFSFSDLVGIFKRNIFLLILLVLHGGTLAYMASVHVPKRYKATAELAIQASYFHNPLVNDIVASVYDPTALNAQKASLVRQALDNEFLDQLGERYNLFQHPAKSRGRAIEREDLLKRIQYYSLNASTYFLSIQANDATVAYEMLTDMVAEVRATLIASRRKTLVQARDAIQNTVESLGLALRDVTDPFAAQRKEVEKLDIQIQTMTSKFSERHPEVVALRRQANVLKRALKSNAAKAPQEGSLGGVYADSSKITTQGIHHELLKKLSYLNIVLEMEGDDSSVSYLGLVKKPSIPAKAFFPKKRIFAAVGLVAGFLFGLVCIVFRELYRGTFLSPTHASDALGVEFLGVLPKLIDKRSEPIRLLDSPQRLLTYDAVAGD